MKSILKENIVKQFELCFENLVENKTRKSIDVEELSGIDYNTLMDMLCDGEYNPIRLYTKFVELWGEEDLDYELVLSNDDVDNTLTLSTCLRGDRTIIKREDKFTPTDIFNIINAINAQGQFYDLFIGFEDDEDYTSTIYNGECFAIYKHWIEDLMNMFKNGELDEYSKVTITGDYNNLDTFLTNDTIKENRLYVIFESNNKQNDENK